MAAANATLLPEDSGTNTEHTASITKTTSPGASRVAKKKDQKKLVSTNTKQMMTRSMSKIEDPAKKPAARSNAKVKKVIRQPRKTITPTSIRRSARKAHRQPQAIIQEPNSSIDAPLAPLANITTPNSSAPINDPGEVVELNAISAPDQPNLSQTPDTTVNNAPVTNDDVLPPPLHPVESNNPALASENRAYYEALMEEHDMSHLMTMVRRRIAANEKRELLRAAITGPFWWHELHPALSKEVVRMWLAISAGHVQDYDEAVQLPLEHPFWTGEVRDDNAVSPAA